MKEKLETATQEEVDPKLNASIRLLVEKLERKGIDLVDKEIIIKNNKLRIK